MKRLKSRTRSIVAFTVTILAAFGHACGTPISDGLVLWLDATDANTLFQDSALTISAGIGDPVGGWMDKSGNGFHSVQTIDSQRPIYQSELINGQAALRFFGEEQDGMLVDDNLQVLRPFTAFIVNQYWGPIQGRTLQAAGSHPIRDPNWLLGMWSGHLTHFADGFVSPNMTAAPNLAYAADAVDDVSSSSFFVNGFDQSADTSPLGEPGALALSGAGTFAEYSDADIAEVLVYDRALSDPELAGVREYLYEKYSIARPTPPNTVLDGALSVFTGGDFGEGLDLQGTFQYAVDIAGPGGVKVGDAFFIDQDSKGVAVISDFSGSGSLLEMGNSTDDNNLEAVFQTAAFSGYGSSLETLQIHLEHIVPGLDYKLQLLFSQQSRNPGFDIVIDGESVVRTLHIPSLVGTPEEPDYSNYREGVVYTREFTADDTSISIELDARFPWFDRGSALIQALTLEFKLDNRGDFNFDGIVDLADFNSLASSFGKDGIYSDGDFTLDGTVDFADFRLFKAAFHSSPALANHAVTEPATFLLGCIAGLGLIASRLAARGRCGTANVMLTPIGFFWQFSTRIQIPQDWFPLREVLGVIITAFVIAIVGAPSYGQSTLTWIANTQSGWSNKENWEGESRSTVPDGDFGHSASINNGGSLRFTSNDGKQDVVDLFIGNGTLDLLGGELTVFGNLTNSGVLRIEGGAPKLFVEGHFSNSGTLVTAFDRGSYSVIAVDGTAVLGGTLALENDRPAPPVGSSWTLINAASVSGKFDFLDTSNARPLPQGSTYHVSTNDTSVILEVVNSLVLVVNRTTGAVSVSNMQDEPVEFDGYELTSETGLLDAERWTTLASRGNGWTAVPPSSNFLAELNLAATLHIVGGGSVDLGTPYVAGYIRPENEDIRFKYTSPSGEIVQGAVEYEGPHNDIVLAVNPETGYAEIRNLSPFADVAAGIDGYAILSATGALDPTGWVTFEDSNLAGPGWRSAPPSNRALAELNLESSKQFDEGTVISVGSIFTSGARRDLVFEYSTIGNGVLPGDADGDGTVTLADFKTLQEHFGEVSAAFQDGDFTDDGVVTLVDFALLKTHFGQSLQPREPGVFRGTVVYTDELASAVVPEPSGWFLFVCGACALACRAGLGRGNRARKCATYVARRSSSTILNVAVGPILAGMALANAGTSDAEDNVARFGVIRQFTGADPGEGLDFEGLFQYAIDVGGIGEVTIGDAHFTNVAAPGFSITSDNIDDPWSAAPEFRDSDADYALNFILHSIQWSGGPSRPVSVFIEDLIPSVDYKLQLLFQERGFDRAFEIIINDELAVMEMFAPAVQGTPELPVFGGRDTGAVYTYEFTAERDTLSIILTGSNTSHPDSNPILNDLTLEVMLDQPGDFNLDGAVDLADFNIMLGHLYSGARYVQGDVNFSHTVDLHDFKEFKQIFHSVKVGAAAPEPPTSILTSVGLWVIAVLSYRKCGKLSAHPR